MLIWPKLTMIHCVLGVLISTNLCADTGSEQTAAPKAELSASMPSKAALKVYRNEQGKIIEQPITDKSSINAVQAVERKVDTATIASPLMMRNPNPDGGWMMILDGQLRAKQTLDRHGKAHCQIDNARLVNHRFSVKKSAAISESK